MIPSGTISGKVSALQCVEEDVADSEHRNIQEPSVKGACRTGETRGVTAQSDTGHEAEERYGGGRIVA
jgi:hypothetical protein